MEIKLLDACPVCVPTAHRQRRPAFSGGVPEFRFPGAALAAACFALLGLAAAGRCWAVPSTFGTTVGHAVLCLNQFDTAYFHQYLVTAFGQPYKHEGGAWWFKSDATLWGQPVTDVLLSDGYRPAAFLAVVADTTPEKLEEAIAAGMGVRHAKMERTQFPVRESALGSRIVYFGKKSKLYCAKSLLLLPN